MIEIGNSEYSSIHIWLKYHYGKASECENKDCEYKNPKRYEWALIKGKKYEKKIENYVMLCPSCHRKYDLNEVQIGIIFLDEQKRNTSRVRRIPWVREKEIRQYSLDNVLVRKWNSGHLASRELNISRSGITNCLKGRTKTSHGFKWQYS